MEIKGSEQTSYVFASYDVARPIPLCNLLEIYHKHTLLKLNAYN